MAEITNISRKKRKTDQTRKQPVKPKVTQAEIDNVKAIGKKPLYTTPEEMQVIIDKYIKDCEGTLVLDKEGNPMLNKFGAAVIINQRPPTVTGLALALGFNSRQTLLNYQDKSSGYMDTISRAKAQVEQYAESRLFDRDGAMGAKFALSNNFKSWTDKQEITQTISQPSTPDEIAAAKAQLMAEIEELRKAK